MGLVGATVLMPKSGFSSRSSEGGSGAVWGEAVGEALGQVPHQLEPGVRARLESASERIQFTQACAMAFDQCLGEGGTELRFGEQAGDIVVIEPVSQFLNTTRAGTAGRVNGD